MRSPWGKQLRYAIVKNIAFIILTTFVFSPLCHAQSTIAGDWQGTLGNQLRLVLHIAAAADGSLSATIDSIDQHALGIPVTAVTLKDFKLSFTIDAIHATYQGIVNKDATKIEGKWLQGQTLGLNFMRTFTPVCPKSTEHLDIDGSWQGSINTETLKLRIVFKFVNTQAGLIATFQSSDQSADWIPVTTVTRKNTSLALAIKPLDIVFEGKIGADTNSIKGIFTQNGNSLPLLLNRMQYQKEIEPFRLQNPIRPYPYSEEDITYTNKAAGNTLAATLTIPFGKGPFPAVLLLVGSGPHDRDESLMGHKPFLILSDYLTRKGIVVLRADKRGIGKSTGDYASATTADFATDAEAGVAYLKTRSEVDQHKIGILGHSEGGAVAAMAAVTDHDVAFIIMMAGYSVPGEQLIVEQGRLIAEASGENKEMARQNADTERELLALVVKERDDAVLKKELQEKLTKQGVPDVQISAMIKGLTSPWFRYFLAYDPATTLREVTCPVLALYGDKDLQVPPGQNIPAIRKALQDGGNKHYEVDELAGLNHLFQTAKTGSPTEYAQIEETISPIALDKIATWILKQ